MRTDQILTADVLDIVFENRNKTYGAYDLRKFYGNRLGKAICFTCLFAGAGYLGLTSFEKDQLSRPEVPDIMMASTIVDLTPVEIVAPKPPMAPAKQSPAIKSQKYVANMEITRNEKEATKLAQNLDLVAIAGTTLEGEPDATQLVKGPEPGNSKGLELAVADVPVDIHTAMATAEVMPAYPGGLEALRKFLQKNLQNPADLEAGEVVAVKIKFVVGYDGKLKSFEIIEDGGKAFNNEVIRVLKKMPEWTPGKSKGQNVSVYYSIPVKFTAAE